MTLEKQNEFHESESGLTASGIAIGGSAYSGLRGPTGLRGRECMEE